MHKYHTKTISWSMLLVLMVLGFSRKLTVTGLECNACTSNSVSCVSETEYVYCSSEGLFLEPTFACPPDFVCTTVNATTCQRKSGGPLVSCLGCDACDENRVFACTGKSNFRLCLGESVPPPTPVISGTCAEGYVCNVYSPQICVNSPTLPPTCTRVVVTPTTEAPTTSTTTTPAPVTDANSYCNTAQQAGRFDAHDVHCKEYIYCYINQNNWGGQLYSCSISTYYNPDLRRCDATVPARCVITSTSTTTTETAPGAITTEGSTSNADDTRSFWRDDVVDNSPVIVPSTGSDPDSYCQELQEIGRFPAGDNECRQFVNCYLNEDIWGGQLYRCPHNGFFNGSTKKCEQNSPPDCSVRV